MELGTFNAYSNILEEIIKSKYLYILLEINVLLKLGIKKHKLLINHLKQYTEDIWEYESLFSTKLVENRLKNSSIYRTRIMLLKKHLKLAQMLYPTISYEPLEDAKRIIARYKKGNQ